MAFFNLRGIAHEMCKKAIESVLKGSQRSLPVICLTLFVLLLLPFVQGTDGHNSGSLDTFVHDYAHKAIPNPRTGTLYNISLPANFSGMEVSVVQLRSSSVWKRGANFKSFHIPSRIIPMPFVKRLALVYQNLDSTARGDAKMISLSPKGDPILVQFPRILEVEDENTTMRCVRFGINGSVEFSNMTMPNVCTAWNQGHFFIVVQSSSSKKSERFSKWWVIGFGLGFVGLVLVPLFGICLCKLFRMKRIGGMEKQSEESEALGIVWVGRSRMPSATGIRTQPVLENEYIP